MISSTRFEQEIETMIDLCGFIVKSRAISKFHEKMRPYSEEAVIKGIELLTNDPPAKLTLKALKSFISQTKVDRPQAKWDGTECDICDMGLIWEKREGYSYIFRCTKCKSYHVESLEWHTPEKVYKLDCKIKEIKKAREEGQTVFLNRESRIN